MKTAEQQGSWYLRNRDRLLKKAAVYRAKNKERIKQYQLLIPKEIKKKYKAAIAEKQKLYMKEYRKVNRVRLLQQSKQYKKTRNATDIGFRLAARLRKRLIRSIESSAKSGSAVTDLGCDVKFLKSYIENRFQPGMTWDNWGINGWHIDHIKPLASFDLTDKNQLTQACHYTNLQPLWAYDNLRKGAKP